MGFQGAPGIPAGPMYREIHAGGILDGAFTMMVSHGKMVHGP